jgi:hypothetical protein
MTNPQLGTLVPAIDVVRVNHSIILLPVPWSDEVILAQRF